MSYTCRFHPLTQQDYNEAYGWYEDKQKELGERFAKAVRQKVEEIALHPEVYGSRSSKKFREAPVDFFPYLIVYKMNKRTKELYISSIHHTKKHPNKKYRKE
jgi:plasmid stabilization system protein ParE